MLKLSTLQRADGFTLIELLIVILIIGILAVIALPSFLKQQEKAKDADAKQRVTQGQRAARSEYKSSDESFPTDLVQLLASGEPQLNVVSGTSYAEGQLSVERASAQAVTFRTKSKSGANFAWKEIGSGVGAGSYRVEGLTGGASYTNTLINPSVESGNTNWISASYGTGASITSTRNAPDGYRGRRSYEATFNGAGNTQIHPRNPGGIGSQLLAVTPGERVYATGAVKLVSGSPGATARLYLAWNDSAGAWFSSALVAQTTGAATLGQWYEFSGAITAPANAAYAYQILYTNSTAVDSVMRADAALILKDPSASPGYFDGDYPDASWTGAAHNSTSVGAGWKGW